MTSDSQSERMFFAGALCALAALKNYDQTAIYDDVVKHVGAAQLVREARRSGNMRWSGMDRYYREHKAELGR